MNYNISDKIDDHKQTTTTTTTTAPMTAKVSLAAKNTLLILNCILLSIGNCGGPLIMRLYFVHGGNRVWLSSFLETGGWPFIVIVLIILYFHRRATNVSTTFIYMRPRLFLAVAFIGIITGLDDYLYAYGVARLPVSTSALIIASQLGFTAFFAYVLVKQKFTPYSINAVVLLTVGAGVLALHTSGDRPDGESMKKYVMGFVMTVAAAALYGFVLPLIELTYNKAKQDITYTLVLEIQMVMCLFATIFCTVGMIVNNDFKVQLARNHTMVWDWSSTPNSSQQIIELFSLLSVIHDFELKGGSDRWKWIGDNSGMFSVKSAKNLLMRDRYVTTGWHMKWKGWAPLKCKIMVWRASMDRLPTKTELIKRGVVLPTILCPLCASEDETALHIFTACSFAHEIWCRIQRWCRLSPFYAFDVQDLLNLADSHHSQEGSYLLRGIIITTMWALWNERNSRIFKHKRRRAIEVMESIKTTSYFWVRHRSRFKHIDWNVWCNSPLTVM